MTAFPSAPRRYNYHLPPLGLNAWAMTNDEVAQGTAHYPADFGHRSVDPSAWHDNNPDMAVERAIQQLLDALGVDEGEHTA
jgi:GTP cyclohydrolase I